MKIDIYNTDKKYNIIYADPPWQFQNRTGKVAPNIQIKEQAIKCLEEQ